MIFTPCRDGISHNEAEHAELGYTARGVDVLRHAALARANRSRELSGRPRLAESRRAVPLVLSSGQI